MASTDALRKELEAVEAELAGLDDRRSALEQAADDLRTAIASVEALSNGTAPTPRRAAKKPASASKRPTVTPDDLMAALQDLGGSASVDELVEKLGLPDGRSLNGARRIAVDAGTVAYEDRTYTLTGSGAASDS